MHFITSGWVLEADNEDGDDAEASSMWAILRWGLDCMVKLVTGFGLLFVIFSFPSICLGILLCGGKGHFIFLFPTK